MKRNVLKNIFFSLVAVLSLGTAFSIAKVAVDKSHERVVETRATDTVSSGQTLFIDLSTLSWWGNGGAWTAVYFYGSNGDAWATAFNNDFIPASSNVKMVIVPTKNDKNTTFDHLIVGRMIPDASYGWTKNTNYWNKSGDIAISGSNDRLKLTSCDDGSSTQTWSIFKDYSDYNTWSIKYGVGGSWSTTYTANLSSYKNDTTDGAQFYGTVELNTNHQFKPYRANGDWHMNSGYVASSSVAVSEGYVHPDGTNNGTITKKGVFTFRVKLSGNCILADVDPKTYAREYAEAFNSANVCGTDDNTKASASKWSTQKTNYLALNSEARAVLTNGTDTNSAVVECLQRYDRVIYLHYSSEKTNYPDFMERIAAGKINLSSGSNVLLFATDNSSNNSNSTLIIIVTIAALSILGGYFFIRRKASK